MQFQQTIHRHVAYITNDFRSYQLEMRETFHKFNKQEEFDRSIAQPTSMMETFTRDQTTNDVTMWILFVTCYKYFLQLITTHNSLLLIFKLRYILRKHCWTKLIFVTKQNRTIYHRIHNLLFKFLSFSVLSHTFIYINLFFNFYGVNLFNFRYSVLHGMSVLGARPEALLYHRGQRQQTSRLPTRVAARSSRKISVVCGACAFT